MAHEAEKSRLSELFDFVQGGLASITRAQQERARLTATAHAASRRVTVTVNADGVLIDIAFSDEIDDLALPEIAQAIITATQDAAAQVQRKGQKILEAAQQDQARIPMLAEFMPDMPDIQSMMPTPPEVSTAPPGSPERPTKTVEPDGTMKFTDVEELDEQARGRSNIAAPDW